MDPGSPGEGNSPIETEEVKIQDIDDNEPPEEEKHLRFPHYKEFLRAYQSRLDPPVHVSEGQIKLDELPLSRMEASASDASAYWAELIKQYNHLPLQELYDTLNSNLKSVFKDDMFEVAVSGAGPGSLPRQTETQLPLHNPFIGCNIDIRLHEAEPNHQTPVASRITQEARNLIQTKYHTSLRTWAPPQPLLSLIFETRVLLEIPDAPIEIDPLATLYWSRSGCNMLNTEVARLHFLYGRRPVAKSLEVPGMRNEPDTIKETIVVRVVCCHSYIEEQKTGVRFALSRCAISPTRCSLPLPQTKRAVILIPLLLDSLLSDYCRLLQLRAPTPAYQTLHTVSRILEEYLAERRDALLRTCQNSSANKALITGLISCIDHQDFRFVTKTIYSLYTQNMPKELLEQVYDWCALRKSAYDTAVWFKSYTRYIENNQMAIAIEDMNGREIYFPEDLNFAQVMELIEYISTALASQSSLPSKTVNEALARNTYRENIVAPEAIQFFDRSPNMVLWHAQARVLQWGNDPERE